MKFLRSSCLLLLASVVAHAETKIGAFADIQYAGESHAWGANGVFINDAAFTINHEIGKGKFTLDLPFKSSDTDNSFIFAEEKAQAFLEYAVSEDVTLRAGQFDSIFGYEASDTKELHFSNQGVISNNVFLSSYEGVMVAVTSGDLILNAVISNPNDQGRLNGKNPDAIVQLGYNYAKDEPILVGAHLSNQNGKTKTTVNTMGGLDLTERFRADFEFDVVSDPDLPSTTLAYFANFIYSNHHHADWGVRAEYLFNGTYDDTPTHSVFTLAVGPKYMVSANLALKAEYDLRLTRAQESSPNEVIHGARASAVYSF